MNILTISTQSALSLAVDNYNARFHEDLRLPIDAETVELAANLAEQRGAHQVAADLRAAITEEAEA